MIIKRESNVFIALSGTSSILNERERQKCDEIVKSLFNHSASKVSEVEESGFIEIVYQIQAPLLDNYRLDEFFENLEVLLYELSEFNAHFTQFERGEV